MPSWHKGRYTTLCVHYLLYVICSRYTPNQLEILSTLKIVNTLESMLNEHEAGHPTSTQSTHQTKASSEG